MGRLLLILGIFFLVWIGYRFLKNTWSARVREIEQRERQQPQANNVQQKVQPKVQQIKACAYCKTHIPEDEGIYENGEFFCSYQHLDRYIEHQKNQ